MKLMPNAFLLEQSEFWTQVCAWPACDCEEHSDRETGECDGSETAALSAWPLLSRIFSWGCSRTCCRAMPRNRALISAGLLSPSGGELQGQHSLSFLIGKFSYQKKCFALRSSRKFISIWFRYSAFSFFNVKPLMQVSWRCLFSWVVL